MAKRKRGSSSQTPTKRARGSSGRPTSTRSRSAPATPARGSQNARSGSGGPATPPATSPNCRAASDGSSTSPRRSPRIRRPVTTFGSLPAELQALIYNMTLPDCLPVRLHTHGKPASTNPSRIWCKVYEADDSQWLTPTQRSAMVSTFGMPFAAEMSRVIDGNSARAYIGVDLRGDRELYTHPFFAPMLPVLPRAEDPATPLSLRLLERFRKVRFLVPCSFSNDAANGAHVVMVARLSFAADQNSALFRWNLVSVDWAPAFVTLERSGQPTIKEQLAAIHSKYWKNARFGTRDLLLNAIKNVPNIRVEELRSLMHIVTAKFQTGVLNGFVWGDEMPAELLSLLWAVNTMPSYVNSQTPFGTLWRMEDLREGVLHYAKEVLAGNL